MSVAARHKVVRKLRPQPLMAALREATFFRKPGRARKYHIVVEGCMACAVRTKTNLIGRPVVEETAELATAVPEFMRCGRPGCRERWPVPPARRRRR